MQRFPCFPLSIIIALGTVHSCDSQTNSALKIVGGKAYPDGYGASTGIVQIQYELKPGDAHIGQPKHCTGTRIGERHILTAAHCIDHADKTRPIDIRLNQGGPYESFSWHESLTLLQDTAWASDRMKRADIAVITLDARKFGYSRLVELAPLAEIPVNSRTTVKELVAIFKSYGIKPAAFFSGYGCNNTTTFAKMNAQGTYNFSGQDVIRYGQAPIVDWPEAKCLAQYPGDTAYCSLDTDRYVVTQGQKIVRQGDPTDYHDDTQIPDPNDPSANSVCWGDSGGPVMIGDGSIAAVISGQTFDFFTDNVLNRHSIPDYDFVRNVISSPILDTISDSPDMDPVQEVPGRNLTLLPGIDGRNVLYAKGYQLDYASFEFEDGTPLAIESVEVLPTAYDPELRFLTTVKLTLQDDASAGHGRIVVREKTPDGSPSTKDRKFVSASETVVSIIPEKVIEWGRSLRYHLLKCGESYQGVQGICRSDTASGLTDLTLVKSEIYETRYKGQTLRFEKLDRETHQMLAYAATNTINEHPTDPLGKGLYSFKTLNCNDNGSGCASVFIDFIYSEGQRVQRMGSECRYGKRLYHEIEPYIYILDAKLVLTELMQPILAAYDQAFPVIVDTIQQEALGACDEVLAKHPPSQPFSETADGEVVPHDGWQFLQP